MYDSVYPQLGSYCSFKAREGWSGVPSIFGRQRYPIPAFEGAKTLVLETGDRQLRALSSLTVIVWECIMRIKLEISSIGLGRRSGNVGKFHGILSLKIRVTKSLSKTMSLHATFSRRWADWYLYACSQCNFWLCLLVECRSSILNLTLCLAMVGFCILHLV